MIVLRKSLGDVSFGIHDRQAVFPFGVHADSSLPKFRSIIRILACPAGSRKSSYCCVPPRQTADGKRKARSEIRQLFGRRSFNVGKLAAEKQKNAVRIFGIDALSRSP